MAELREWIEEDRYCDAKGNYRPGHNANEKAALYQALEEAHGNMQANPCLSGLLSKGKKQILYYASKSEDESCQFLRALVLTGQFSLEEKISPEEKNEGEALLRNLATLHPNNGIYPLFLLGATKNTAYLRTLLQAREFRNPLNELGPHLQKLGFQNATALFYSAEAMAGIRSPDYQDAFKAARGGLSDPNLKTDYQFWLRAYLADLEEIRRLRLGEPFVWAVEIGTLRGIATAGWKAHGEGPLPPLLEKKQWEEIFRMVTNIDAYAPFSVEENPSCERTHEKAKSVLPQFAAFAEAMARRRAEYR